MGHTAEGHIQSCRESADVRTKTIKNVAAASYSVNASTPVSICSNDRRPCAAGSMSWSMQGRQDKTRQDKTRQDKTRQDKTRQDKTRQDKTRQDNLFPTHFQQHKKSMKHLLA